MTTTRADNPLLDLPFHIAFDRIRPEHAEPAVDTLIAEARERLARVAAQADDAGFLDALDHLTADLDSAVTVVGTLHAVVTSPEWRAAFSAVLPKISAFYTEMQLSDELWAAIKRFADTDAAKALRGERARFLELTLDRFRRGGADLPADKKARVKAIDLELADLTNRFGQNVLDGTAAFELVVTGERLAGLPQRVKDALRVPGTDTFRLTLHEPVRTPVLKYADDRELRREIWEAGNRTGTGEGRDNRLLIPQILRLRQEKAELLGFANFADLVTQERMVGDATRAVAFERELEERIRPFFERENAELERFYRTQAGPDAPALAAWDAAYWAEKQRQAEYDFDEEEVRPYFPLEGVLSGMFEITRRVFGATVTKSSAPGWHPEVEFYDIHDAGGRHVASFYTDWFPRDTKRAGAWMNEFKVGGPREDGFQPHLGLMCGNITPPANGRPALLSKRDVETVFHEFGHLLHLALSRVPVRSLSGTRVPRDFVELPSQIMENWTWERESLDLFARHYETGEPIPQALFDKMVAAKNFFAANAAMRQLSFGTVDLDLHMRWKGEDVIAFARDVMARFTPTPLPDDFAMITAFSHLFGSAVGYAGGYYSYKWSEVLDADAFSRFEREGLLNPEVGRDFVDKLLSRGNGEDPAQLYRDFMGRDPDAEALLRRSGLVSA